MKNINNWIKFNEDLEQTTSASKNSEKIGEVVREFGDSDRDPFYQEFIQKYPTKNDFDRAYNRMYPEYPAGNAIDPMYDRWQDDNQISMLKNEFPQFDTSRENRWKWIDFYNRLCQVGWY